MQTWAIIVDAFRDAWKARAAIPLGLDFTLRPCGCPATRRKNIPDTFSVLFSVLTAGQTLRNPNRRLTGARGLIHKRITW